MYLTECFWYQKTLLQALSYSLNFSLDEAKKFALPISRGVFVSLLHLLFVSGWSGGSINLRTIILRFVEQGEDLTFLCSSRLLFQIRGFYSVGTRLLREREGKTLSYSTSFRKYGLKTVIKPYVYWLQHPSDDKRRRES